MKIVVGSGNSRHVFERPGPRDKAGRDKMAEDLKNFLFRPKMLSRG